MTDADRTATLDAHAPAQAVATRLHAAALHLLRRLRREDRTLGLSGARLSALSVVVFGGPIAIGELAAAEDVTPPTMTRLVAALEADGLVRRRPDAADKRAVRIEATTKGRRLMERGRGLRTASLARGLALLPPADLETLDRAAALVERLLRDPADGRTIESGRSDHGGSPADERR